jgi:hypothetical protein
MPSFTKVRDKAQDGCADRDFFEKSMTKIICFNANLSAALQELPTFARRTLLR